jgi:beta-lactamase regulating signal transducer with metallopeptidase domain
MIPIVLQHIAPWLVAHIAEPAVRSLVLGSLAGVALTAFRPKSICLQLVVWTTILYAALAMPFLGWLLPAVPLRLPAIHTAKTVPAPAQNFHVASSSGPLAARLRPLPVYSYHRRERRKDEVASGGSPVPAAPPVSNRNFWIDLLVCVYLSIASVLLARFGLGFIWSRWLRQRSTPIRDPRARALLDHNAEVQGVTNLPLLAESCDLSVPGTLGLRHPTILLPSGWQQWGNPKLSAVLAHELSHVKRHDALTRSLLIVHRCFFWFSPLAWWLSWQLAELAEEASDEAALQACPSASCYAEVLLDFFASLGPAGRRVRWHAISIAHGSRAERRLDRIFHGKATLPSRLRKPVFVLFLACAAPVVCLLAAAQPFVVNAQSAVVTSGGILAQAQPAPLPGSPQGEMPSPNKAVPPAPPSPTPPNPQFGRTAFPEALTHEAPPPPAPPQPAPQPLPAPAVLVTSPPLPAPPPAPEPPGAAQNESSSLEEERQGTVLIANGEWFFQGNGTTDARVPVPSDVAAELEEVDAAIKQLGANASQRQLDRLERQLCRVQREIERLQTEAGGRSVAIREQVRDLGRRQQRLGREQDRLEREQFRLGRRADRVMDRLIDRATARGLARPQSR